MSRRRKPAENEIGQFFDILRCYPTGDNDLMNCACRGCLKFVKSFVWWCHGHLGGPFDCEGAMQAGIVSVLEAIRDGQMTDDGIINRYAKTRIRRDIKNAVKSTMPATLAPRPQTPDYGYADGRTIRVVPRKIPKDTCGVYRSRMLQAGMCPRCGNKPEAFKLCNRCRRVNQLNCRRRRDRKSGRELRKCRDCGQPVATSRDHLCDECQLRVQELARKSRIANAKAWNLANKERRNSRRRAHRKGTAKAEGTPKCQS